MSDEKTLEQLIHFVTELLPMAGAGVLPSQEFGAGSPFRYDQEMNPNVKRARDNALIAGLAAIEAVADRMARQFEVAPATGGEE